MFLVTKNETRRQPCIVHVPMRVIAEVDGWAGVDSGALMGLEGSEAPAQETQLLGPRRVGRATGSCLFWAFPWRLSVNPNQRLLPSPTFLLLQELLY